VNDTGSGTPPSFPENFDLVVLGTGSAGADAATRCRKEGWTVAIVDDMPYGGTCSLRGCTPKKVLYGAGALVDWHRRMVGFGVDACAGPDAGGVEKTDWPALMQFKRGFTDPVPEATEAKLAKVGIVTLHGVARFVSEDRLVVGDRQLTAGHVLIATGATPRPLGIPGAEHVRTSTDFMDLDQLPARIAFVGAGYISFEFAHMVQRAGSQAIVIGQDTPLGQFDQDVVNCLVEHSRKIGIDIRTETRVTSVERSDGVYRVHTSSGGQPGTVDADLVVHGAGRIPNTGHLDLKSGNVAANEHGAIAVNEFLQSTSNPRVYAAGDCTLPPGSLPLTPVAAHERIVATSNILNGNNRTPDYRGTPSVVFTVPPLATVGLTEVEARDQGIAVEVKSADTASWFSNRRVREPAGMFKTVVEKGTGRVVGAHLLGIDAAEVINIFALAIRHDLSATDLKHMIYAYPTGASDIVYML
jgi:glutathione reductase (NADPH)